MALKARSEKPSTRDPELCNILALKFWINKFQFSRLKNTSLLKPRASRSQSLEAKASRFTSLDHISVAGELRIANTKCWLFLFCLQVPFGRVKGSSANHMNGIPSGVCKLVRKKDNKTLNQKEIS